MEIETMSSAPDEAFVAELRLTLQHIGRRIRRRAGIELPPAKYSALSAISRNPEVSLGTLGRLEQLGKSTITRLTADLDKLGLVLRTPAPTDGRSTCVRITPKGSQLLHTADARVDAYLRIQLSALNLEDVATLSAAVPVLRKLLDARVPTESLEVRNEN
jgi:DNA-binding MarR family transcriptional regulator